MHHARRSQKDNRIRRKVKCRWVRASTRMLQCVECTSMCTCSLASFERVTHWNSVFLHVSDPNCKRQVSDRYELRLIQSAKDLLSPPQFSEIVVTNLTKESPKKQWRYTRIQAFPLSPSPRFSGTLYMLSLFFCNNLHKNWFKSRRKWGQRWSSNKL